MIVLKHIAQEHGNNGRRSLVGPSLWSLCALATDTRRISPCRATARMTASKNNRTGVVMRVSPGLSRLAPVSSAIDQFQVLSRAVDAGKRLLVQEKLKAIAVAYSLHRLHNQHVMVVATFWRLEGTASS